MDNTNKKQNPNWKKNNFQPKPVTITLTVLSSGITETGREYDTMEVYDILNSIQKSQVFDMLIVNVNASKSLFEKINWKNANGSISIGRLLNFNNSNGTIDLRISSKNAYLANDAKEFVIAPRVIVGNDGHVKAISSFDLIDPSKDI